MREQRNDPKRLNDRHRVRVLHQETSITKNRTIMKRLLVLTLLGFSLSSYAQKVLSGTFELPAEEKYLTLDWDCTQTIFDKKYTEKEWHAIKGDDWPNAKKQVMEGIVRDMNEKMGKTRIIAVLPGSELHGAYTLYICPQKLDSKGNNKSTYILKDAQGTEIGRAEFTGDGGHWGTFANLMGDGYEKAGSKLGALITKYNKMRK